MQPVYLALIVCSLVSWTSAHVSNEHVHGHDTPKSAVPIQPTSPGLNDSVTGIGKDNQTLKEGRSLNGSQETSTPVEEQITFCPEGWVVYKERCIYFSKTSTTYFQQDYECLKLNSLPAEILSEDKFKSIAEVIPSSDVGFMLSMRKPRGYLPVTWSSGKVVSEYYMIPGFESLLSSYRETCVVMDTDFQLPDYANCHDDFQFICEKEKDCVPGRFGPGCKSECHCLGEPCNTASGAVTCKSGCEAGWVGESCSEAKKRPEVRYFCINSQEEHIGNYVDVHIHAHAVKYRSIYAQLANSPEKGPWCPGTTVSSWEDNEHLTITIRMNDTVVDEIRDGKCVGREMLKNQFEWTLVIQEYDGILLDTDLQVVISCDFNTSETLERSAMSGSSETEDHKFSKKIEQAPEVADVTLEVVDPFTEQVIREAHVGTPVKLRIKYGSQKGSMVKGVRSHHCVATCKSGHTIKDLLGHDGCPAPGSPVQSFAVDTKSNNSISTNYFPLFTFVDHDAVVFKCGFELCFHSHECEPGCRRSNRRRRSATKMYPDFPIDQSIDWTSSFIHILPDTPPQEKVTESPTTTEKHQKSFQDMINLLNGYTNNQKLQEGKKKTSQTTTTKEHPAWDTDVHSLLLPITCGVLLLLLLVSITVFLTVHFNLRRTVDEMRQEMLLGWRSRVRVPYTRLSPGKETTVCSDDTFEA